MTDTNDTLEFPDEPMLPTVRGDSTLADNAGSKLKDDYIPINVQEEDVEGEVPNPHARDVYVNEMSACDLYMHNIHKGFKYVTTVQGIISLVGAGLGVMRARRQFMERASNLTSHKPDEEDSIDDVVFDNNGNIIGKKVKR